MTVGKLGVAGIFVALSVGALGCHKNSGTQPTTGIANSSGSYAADAAGVPGTETDSTGVGATGVPANEVAAPPTNVPVSAPEEAELNRSSGVTR